MRNFLLFAIAGMIWSISTSGQNPAIELSFTGMNDASYVQLDSIRITNHDQGGDTLLIWPDTVLSLLGVGIHKNILTENVFSVFQNHPNPVGDHTMVTLFVPRKGKVGIRVTNLQGQVIFQTETTLEGGRHSFRLTPGDGTCFIFNACWMGQSSSIKILHAGAGSGLIPALDYAGMEDRSALLKGTHKMQGFDFAPGDTLLIAGYWNGLESGIVDTPWESASFTLQFATNIPCPGTSTVTYEGQVYNTIQVFSQCWLKENLNVGTMIPGTNEMQDNGIIEKYCWNDEEDSCSVYGGLYQWSEMMDYKTTPGSRGICPPGWHVPIEMEWNLLEGAVDSHYGIFDPEWEQWGFRGFDVGTNLKSGYGWENGGNGTDLFGFTGLPAGFCHLDGNFLFLGECGYWWTSSQQEGNYDWARTVVYDHFDVFRNEVHWGGGHSVRCVRDY